VNFSPFEFDFDFSGMSGFEAAEKQFMLEPIDLVKQCGQFRTYAVSFTVMIDL